MSHVCLKITQLYHELTPPLRTGNFYILLRTNKLQIQIYRLNNYA